MSERVDHSAHAAQRNSAPIRTAYCGLNRVVETEKAAQANVTKRREETAATRSLLNTARLMDENPTLLRLKELEVLEKVTEKVDRLTVFGGLDGVLKDTVRINVRPD